MEKQRILIVDDDKRFTRILKLNLENRGFYDVREENRGVHALAAARNFKPDMILLDVMMPDIDGGEVASQIRSDFRLKTTPIVFLTAAASKQEVELLDGSIGGHAFLAKPATVGDVLQCLRKHLGPVTSTSGMPGITTQPVPITPATLSRAKTLAMDGPVASKKAVTVPNRIVIPALIIALMIGLYWGYQLYTQPQRMLRQTLAELQNTIVAQRNARLAATHNSQKSSGPGTGQPKAASILGAPISLDSNGVTPSTLLNSLAVSIVKLRCQVSSTSDQARRGSGILYKANQIKQTNPKGTSPYFIQTSLHVVKTTDGSSPKCKIFLYPDHTKGDSYFLFKSEGYRFYRQDVDFAILEPQIVEDNDQSGSMADLSALARDETRTPLCNSTEIGDRLSIMGYPAIGGETLTVTEGIISGFEFQGETRFIKSSAKLDHGNSGGLAIKESGCVVGIPTFVQRGQLESMGRILDLNYLRRFVLK